MPDLLNRSSAHIARTVGRRRRFALALGALGGTALLMLAAGVFSRADARATRLPPQSERPALASIPAAAQGAISAALGREQSGYRLVGLRARNSTQRFGAAFSRDGATIDSGSARVRFRLLSYGRATVMRIARQVDPRVSGNRVHYARPGVDEWYANGPLGLEQGFDVSVAPSAGHGR
jgi:hypothetical protein